MIDVLIIIISSSTGSSSIVCLSVSKIVVKLDFNGIFKKCLIFE